jgi:hypothetical protein
MVEVERILMKLYYVIEEHTDPYDREPSGHSVLGVYSSKSKALKAVEDYSDYNIIYRQEDSANSASVDLKDESFTLFMVRSVELNR